MDTKKRNEEIRSSDEHWSVLAKKHGLSKASIYRIRREAPQARPEPQGRENFNARAKNHRLENWNSKRKAVFGQISTSGLTRHGGMVAEEFQRELQDDSGIAVYTEMATNPVVSAVLFAIEMSLRKVNWWWQAASDDKKDMELKEFVESCFADMSQSQQEVMSQIFRPMLIYGFSLCETVYKKRMGMNPGSYVDDPAKSRYNDGKIGWRRWQFINPASLSTGERWDFDEYGRVQGVTQIAAPTYEPVYVPMEKMLLFRATVMFDNPEGQALALDTPIPTPSGWTTMGDIQVGDMVYDSQGKIRYVVAKSETWKGRPVYRVTFKDGAEVIADENHLWDVTTSTDRIRSNPTRTITTKEIYEWENRTKTKQFFSAGMTPVLDAPGAVLPIDPYILGYWLGDGNKASGAFGVSPGDFDSFKEQVEAGGLKVTSYDGKMDAYVSGLKVLLRAIGVLDDKHIPQAYLRASYEQRLALLQGLMDSDGYSNPHNKDRRSLFYNSNEVLIEQAAELIRSLGGRVHKRIFNYAGTESNVGGRVVHYNHDSYGISFFIDVPAHRLQRKLDGQTPKYKQRTNGHFISRIEPAGNTDTVCIEVDSPDHTYLASTSMIPTHNSVLRPMYKPWYYAENLGEIEAIGAERLGLGLPVMYLGEGTSLGDGDSDYELAQDIVVNVRADEQAGVVIPHPKMTSEGRGVLFELISPPSRGIVDFDKVVTRYEQRMAMTALAQFIFLGMTKVGTQALAGESIDLFASSVGGWAQAAADVINRFAVPRLLELNGITVENPPTLEHSELEVPDLKGVSEYVNKLVGSQLLVPYPELARHLLDLAHLPQPEDDDILDQIGKAPPGGEGGAGGEMIQLVPPDEEGEEAEEEETEEALSDAVNPTRPSILERFAEFFANWGAKGGGVIAGALGRDSAGQFVRIGEGETSPENLIAAMQSGQMTAIQAEAMAALGLIAPGSGGQAHLTPLGVEVYNRMKADPGRGAAWLKKHLENYKKGGRGKVSIKAKKRPTPKKGKAKAKKKGKAKGGGGGGGGEEEEKPLEERVATILQLLTQAGMTETDLQALLSIASDPSAAESFEFDDLTRLVGMGLLERKEVENGVYEYSLTDVGQAIVGAIATGDVDAISKMIGEASSGSAEPEEETGAGGGEEPSPAQKRKAKPEEPLDWTRAEIEKGEAFALRLKPGGPKYERATNAYQLTLQAEWEKWAVKTARELEKAEDDDERRRILEEAVAAIVALLRTTGREYLPEALALGMNKEPPSPEALRLLAEAIASNDRYLAESLGPDVVEKILVRGRDDPNIWTERAAILALLLTFLGRVGSYSGTYWTTIWRGWVEWLKQQPGYDKVPVRWVLDEHAKHCSECPVFARDYANIDDLLATTGDRMPGQVECGPNCRCHLEVLHNGQWVRAF